MSIHPRFIQFDDGAGGGLYGSQYALDNSYSGQIFDEKYSTPLDRSERLTLLSGISPTRSIEGINLATQNVLALSNVQVVPSSGTTNMFRARPPWLLMTMIVMDKTTTGGQSKTANVDVCGSINIEEFVRSNGKDGFSPKVCDLGGLFDLAIGGSYLFMHFPSASSRASLALVPTRPKYDMYSVEIVFMSDATVGGVSKIPIETPLQFTSNTKIPGNADWASTVTRNSLLFSNVVRERRSPPCHLALFSKLRSLPPGSCSRPGASRTPSSTAPCRRPP